MKEVWRFELNTSGKSDVSMPQGAKILCAMSKGDNAICIWAEVDPKAIYELRRFSVYPTGVELRDMDNLRYIGTAQLLGPFIYVCHIYERLIP